MARIRTVKPEYWTDEVIVQLPFQARLLFIGIWNFADDHGAVEENPDRLRMQIFPAEPTLNTAEIIDLLVAANLLERFIDDEGNRVIQVRNWHKHQKVDNPAKSRILSEKYRKLAIPREARRALAVKYGCQPGETMQVTCYFCGMPGRIHWWNLSDGRPSSWVVFDLEIDHLEPEAIGGANSAENLVLSCRTCNRGRRDKLALPWILSQRLASPSDPSPTPRGSLLGMEGNVREGNGEEHTSASPPARKVVSRETKVDPDWWLDFKLAYPNRAGDQGWRGAQRAANARMSEGYTSEQFIAGAKRYAAYCDAKGDTGTQYVKRAEAFLGPENHFLEPWTPPPSRAEKRLSSNLSAADEFMRRTEVQ